MPICPNLNIASVKREFQELVDVLGENAAYNIWDLNNGNPLDKSSIGTDSILFKSLLDLTNGDRKKAIELKAKTFTKSFREWFGDSTMIDEYKEPLIVDQRGFMNTQGQMRNIFNQGTFGKADYNIPIKEGVNELFESNPELANEVYSKILTNSGISDETIDRHAASYEQMLEDIKSEPISNFELTPQQKQEAQQLYSQYLDTIFPDSRVKDIVYHGTNAEFEKFDKTKFHTSKAFHFSNLKETLLSKIKKPVLLNILNPIDEMPSRYEQDVVDDRKKQGYDGTITDADYKEYERKPELGKEYVVFEPEQIHILSSKKDLEMFRNFINFTKSEYAKYGDIQQFRDYIMSKNFAAIEEFLVVNNKIDRKC